MGKINELAISDSNVNMNIVEKYGTFRLQSDKQITENGKHTADVGFNGLSSVNVNVSGGGGADLEDNKTVSITENGVVEITPTAGKDGMKKVTATVNVSGGGGDTPTPWYLWQDNDGFYLYLPFATAPDTLDSLKFMDIGDSLAPNTFLSTMNITSYTKNSDTEFTIVNAITPPVTLTYTRITEDIPIGGGADLEDNKTATIDVSTYNAPVEVTPTQGKDGMKKATITLSNIPSGGSSTLYAFMEWNSSDWGNDIYFCDKKNPSVGDTMLYINSDWSYSKSDVISIEGDLITIDDGTVKRYPDNDITF